MCRATSLTMAVLELLVSELDMWARALRILASSGSTGTNSGRQRKKIRIDFLTLYYYGEVPLHVA
jgi:hypothetical protein